MKQSQYIWLVIHQKRAKSQKKQAYKSLNHISSKLSPRNIAIKRNQRQQELFKQKIDRQAENNRLRILQLEQQNMILRKQNAMLSEYYYMHKSRDKDREINSKDNDQKIRNTKQRNSLGRLEKKANEDFSNRHNHKQLKKSKQDEVRIDVSTNNTDRGSKLINFGCIKK